MYICSFIHFDTLSANNFYSLTEISNDVLGRRGTRSEQGYEGEGNTTHAQIRTEAQLVTRECKCTHASARTRTHTRFLRELLKTSKVDSDEIDVLLDSALKIKKRNGD